MQEPRYDAESEMTLMSRLWAPSLKDDPLAFVMFLFPWGQPGTPLEHFTGPRKWQREVLRDLGEHIKQNKGKINFDTLRMATASGRGIGKSALVSWLTIWMLTTRIGSSTIVSANSENQLRSITWSEITKWLSMSLNSHWFEVSATKVQPAKWLTELVERDLRLGTRYWAIEGRLWSEENPDGYAGVHNFAGVLLVFDEASGIADPIWSVASGFFTENTPNRFWFAFSNPRRGSGYFFSTFHDKRDFWRTRTVDARTVEDTDKAVYQQIIDEYGASSPQAYVEVYGEFPPEGDEQFISRTIVEEAVLRNKDSVKDPEAPIIIGVDPARFGADATVIVVRQGRHLIALKRYRGEDTMETVGRIVDAIEEFQPALVCIDEGGLGAGVYDRLKEQQYKQVRPVNFGSSSKKPIMYANKRAEMWGLMREWLKTGAIPDDRLLKKDLTTPKQELTSTGTFNGAIKLESKVKMKERGQASPDAGDALALTFAFPVAGKARGKARVDKPRNAEYGRNNNWMAS